MVHGLRAAHAVVDDDAEAVVAQALLLGHPLRDEEQVPQGRLVPVAGGLGEPAEPVAALGDDEEVDGGLRRDVAEGWSFFLESVRVFSYRGREKRGRVGGLLSFSPRHLSSSKMTSAGISFATILSKSVGFPASALFAALFGVVMSFFVFFSRSRSRSGLRVAERQGLNSSPPPSNDSKKNSLCRGRAPRGKLLCARHGPN